MTLKFITWSFYLLLFLTPLIFFPVNHELFEYNKMILVYFLTATITACWLIRMIGEKSLIFKITPLDIPILIFLISQILSTIFSIDPHTSIWGYYSRSNGGLLSIVSYILLYYAFVSNFTSQQLPRFLKVMLGSGFLVALYAIPEHFGISPSCILLTQTVTADCWVQDVQARVFATMGQPNWLAAYLAMLIFPALYFFLQAKSKVQLVIHYLIVVALYMAFTFTYARGATLGLLAGLITFLSFWFIQNLRLTSATRLPRWSFRSLLAMTKPGIKPILIILVSLLLINIIYGSALTRFRLITQAPPAPKVTQSSVTQLETGGTESGQIRLIVWKGALEIFKKYPFLGSGVETFAYSYYNFRPIEHNLVSEWDFLYNKAHNEYLNYLATTGIIGFLSYLAIILTFIFWEIRYVLSVMRKKQPITHHSLLITSLLAGYISYLVQNFFGFSVVMIAVLFFLFPAFAFVATESNKTLKLPRFITKYTSYLTHFIFSRSSYTHTLKILIIFILFSTLSILLKNWTADTFYKNGSDYSDAGNAGRSYNYLVSAVRLNKDEPLYRSDLGFAAASAAVALASDDATTSAQLKDEAILQTEKALSISSANVSLWRTAIRTYYQLSALDPKYEGETLRVLDQSIKLAPTDAKLYYNKGLILSQIGKVDEGITMLKKALELKPNYREAYLSLGLVYKEQGKKAEAKTEFEKVLKLKPGDEETVKYIEELEGNK